MDVGRQNFRTCLNALEIHLLHAGHHDQIFWPIFSNQTNLVADGTGVSDNNLSACFAFISSWELTFDCNRHGEDQRNHLYSAVLCGSRLPTLVMSEVCKRSGMMRAGGLPPARVRPCCGHGRCLHRCFWLRVASSPAAASLVRSCPVLLKASLIDLPSVATVSGRCGFQ